MEVGIIFLERFLNVMAKIVLELVWSDLRAIGEFVVHEIIG